VGAEAHMQQLLSQGGHALYESRRVRRCVRARTVMECDASQGSAAGQFATISISRDVKMH